MSDDLLVRWIDDVADDGHAAEFLTSARMSGTAPSQ
jgi:hypothetical protein